MDNLKCNEKDQNKELSVLLYNLFVTNTYAIAVQCEDGRYITRYLPVSEYLIEEMLNQGGSLGCYQQCYKSNMLKWICFDFDSPNPDNPEVEKIYLHYIEPLKQICDEYGINYLTEFSGRRGIHLWIIFSHLIPKDKAFFILSFLRNKLISTIGDLDEAKLDAFPATDSSKGNVVGKQVKIPLSVHKAGKQSWFFEGIFSKEVNHKREEFLNEQINILNKYTTNDYEMVIRKLGYTDDEYIKQIKYRKYQVESGLSLSIREVIDVLSETTVYKQIFDRLMQGRAYRQDWLVVLGTFSPLNDGGEFIEELYSSFPNYDSQKTAENIRKFQDKYYPATFEYLYKIYGLEIETDLDKTDTGYSFLLKKRGIEPKAVEGRADVPRNEKDLFVTDTVRKEIKYICDNDEVPNITIWNRLHSINNQEIKEINDYVNKIVENRVEKIVNPQAVVYERKENEKKVRRLISLDAKDRILTTHVALLLQSRMKNTWKSYSYNVALCSREDIFYNWYTSWSEYLNRIKTFLEIPFMGMYEVFTVDLKNFYDNIDFLAVYNRLRRELGAEENNLFKFLVEYNDCLMRKISGGRRKG